MRVLGEGESLNQSLEKAGRVADFLEFGELLCRDALHREESCGGHFRVEHQTEDGEALRDDEHFAYVAAWEYTGDRRDARCSTRSRSSSSTSTSPRGRTSSERSRLRRLAPGGARTRTGAFETYEVDDVSPDMSFLELFDVLNERLISEGDEPVAFDHDCREGICGSCAMMINGRPHGPRRGTATCQLHMRKFEDGAHITVEPWRAAAFPVLKDLVVDRSRVRPHRRGRRLHHRPDGHRARRQPHPRAQGGRRRGDGRGRVHRVRRVRGRVPERRRAAVHRGEDRSTSTCCRRVSPSAGRASIAMVDEMERWFGSCTNHGECEAACPKEISIDFIALLNRDYVKAQFKNRKLLAQKG